MSLVGRQIAGARRHLLTLGLAVLFVVVTIPSVAGAVERDATYENGPQTPFYFSGVDVDTSDVLGLPPTAADGGLDVIGDSVSVNVPYVQRAAESGLRAHLRAWGAWTVRFHRTVTGWPSTAGTSVQAAATGDAAAVFVALGTNDIGCFTEYAFCPDTPTADSPEYPPFLEQQRQAVHDEVETAAATLVAAGKCVVWAGPRRGSTGYTADADVEILNAQLRDLEAANPGRFTYVDYDAFSHTYPSLVADFSQPESDGIHPRTEAGRAAVADLAVRSVEQHCMLTTEPRVTVSPPLPLPPAPSQPAPLASAPPVELPMPPQQNVLRANVDPSAKGCPSAPSVRSRRICFRDRAVMRCRRSRARANCLRRVRHLYGPSAAEKTALRHCTKRRRVDRVRCRAAATRTYRLR